MPHGHFICIVLTHRCLLEKVRNKKAEEAKTESLQASGGGLAGLGSQSDQQQTLAMDLSPIANTFFGPGAAQAEKANAFTRPKEDDEESLLRARTRRLASFADDGGDVREEGEGLGGGVPKVLEGAKAPGGDDGHDLQPRKLESVFDQEALSWGKA